VAKTQTALSSMYNSISFYVPNSAN